MVRNNSHKQQGQQKSAFIAVCTLVDLDQIVVKNSHKNKVAIRNAVNTDFEGARN